LAIAPFKTALPERFAPQISQLLSAFLSTCSDKGSVLVFNTFRHSAQHSRSLPVSVQVDFSVMVTVDEFYFSAIRQSHTTIIVTYLVIINPNMSHIKQFRLLLLCFKNSIFGIINGFIPLISLRRRSYIINPKFDKSSLLIC
jgi:hypothetical protein